MPDTKKDWIVGIGGNEMDCVDLTRYNNLTTDEMKQVLVDLVAEARSDDCYNRIGCKHDYETCEEECCAYDSGTEAIEDVSETNIHRMPGEVELSASANFDDYHLDYTAIPLSAIQTVE